MDTQTFQKASKIITAIKSISDRITFMENSPGEISYYTDIYLEELHTKHKNEVMEAFRARKAELEKELAEL